MSKTKNYNLNIPSGQEKVSIMGGINPNFVKIDEELKNVDNKTITNKEEITKINTSLESLKKGVSSDTDSRLNSLTAQLQDLQKKVIDLSNKPSESHSSSSHIGQIILSTVLDTEEKVKNLYGGTSWVQVKDKFILGCGIHSVKEKGGSFSISLTSDQMPAHDHYIPPLSGKTSEDGTHQHRQVVTGTVGGDALRADYWSDVKSGDGGASYDQGALTMGAGAHTHTVTTEESQTGVSGKGNNIDITNPYYSVFVWERTA